LLHLSVTDPGGVRTREKRDDIRDVAGLAQTLERSHLGHAVHDLLRSPSTDQNRTAPNSIFVQVKIILCKPSRLPMDKIAPALTHAATRQTGLLFITLRVKKSCVSYC
jgi:hypothetical protein